ncbi:MAG TPA: DNA-binding protein Alba [Thermoplasmata archaeon]|nr:DNA-binding protein Alba [Thermoplasmata archaeon]
MPDPPARESPTEPRAEGIVYIGNRPLMTYVFQVVAQLNAGPGVVLVKARGSAISKAVDVVEVVRRRFLEGQVALGSIQLGTERLRNRDGRDANVSSIAIPLQRSGPPPAARPGPPAGPA